MAIAFNEIPAGLRVPLVFTEVDSSRAQRGPALQQYNVLLIGGKLSSGTKPELQFDTLSSASQANEYYGNGSILANIAAAFFANNKINTVTAIAIDDHASGVQAAGSVNFAGTATAAGSIYTYVGGRRYVTAVAIGDVDDDVCAAVVADIQADPDRLVTAAVNGSDDTLMDLTARNDGETGNAIDIRLNYRIGENLPAGITAAVTAMSGGANNPAVSEVITALDETQYHVIVMPYTDDTNMDAMEAELSDRWGPLRQNDGHVFVSVRATVSNLTTYGNARNSLHSTVMGMDGPNSPWEWAAAIAGQVAIAGQRDPARPFQTLPLSGILAPEQSERWLLSEANTLLSDGIATYDVAGGDIVRIQRLVTTYQTNAFGDVDTAFLDLNSKLTLSYIRYALRVRIQSRYPNYKVANDGTRFGPGQAIITPKLIRAELYTLFREWESIGLVENFDQFANDLIVERNATDPNRVDVLMGPDLVNQFRVLAAKIQFLL